MLMYSGYYNEIDVEQWEAMVNKLELLQFFVKKVVSILKSHAVAKEREREGQKMRER